MASYLKNIARRWRREIAAPAEVKYVFSPYLTSRTAESVLSDAGPCEIHTLFSAELFCSRASSLKTLKALMSAGHNVFHLPGLHAKIVLVPGAFASIGSQNLTHGGTRNKEASVAFNEPKAVRRVGELIGPWLADRIPVTAEMVTDMEALLEGIIPLYEIARLAAVDADKKVCEAESARTAENSRLAAEIEARRAALLEESLRLERETEERLRAERAEREHLRLEEERRRIAEDAERRERASMAARLRSNFDTAEQSLSKAYGVVTVIESGGRWSSTRTISLRACDDRHLTVWEVGGKRVELVKGLRYLILQDNGKIGWGRVMQTRISFVSEAVKWDDYLTAKGFVFQAHFHGDWSPGPPFGRNVRIEVTDVFDGYSCEVSAWFDLKELKILKVELPYPEYALEEQRRIVETINSAILEFSSACVGKIVSPFRYEVGGLSGADAQEFFGSIGSVFELRVALVGRHPIILARNFNQ